MRCLKKLFSCNSGAAHLEFAICAQLLLLLFVGSIQLIQTVVIAERTEYMVSMATDSVTEGKPYGGAYAPDQLGRILHQLTRALYFSDSNTMMGNSNSFGEGYTTSFVFTDVQAPATGTGAPVIIWKYCGPQSPKITDPVGNWSKTGSVGAAAALPSGFTMNPGEEVLIGEAYTRWSALPMISFTTIYRTAYYMPRKGSLGNLVKLPGDGVCG